MRSMPTAAWRMFAAGLLAWAMAACGGGGGSDPPPPAPTPPVIAVQPAAVAVEPGSAASFSVTATGTAPLSYQWQRDGANIAGATGATLSLATTDLADNGSSLRVIVSNAVGSATSEAVVLTVAVAPSPPRVVIAPQTTRVNDGERATLTVSAEGTAPLRYQWRRNGAVIADATAASFTTPELGLGDSGAAYDVVVSNALGSVTSGVAAVTVDAVAARIASEPADLTVVAGQAAAFRAEATGSAPLRWQWQRNGVDIAGATSASYTVAVAGTADDGALFRAVASNAAGSSTSRAARLSVTAAAVAPSIAAAPTALTVDEGAEARFTVVASGTAPLSYQWRRNGVDIAGATSTSLALATAALADNGARYSVRVSNAAGAITSAEAVLTVSSSASVLTGRSWALGQLLESDDNPVRERAAVIDDEGRVLTVFGKSNGTRDVIYASRSSLPTPSGPASWSTPRPIDLLAGNPVSRMSTVAGRELYLAGSPSGHAVAVWFDTAACTAATYSTSGSCRYYYLARFDATTELWSEPALLTDAPDPGFRLRINDRGDIALLGNSWVRSGTVGRRNVRAVFLRASGESTFRRQLLDDTALSTTSLHLDAAGHILLAGQYGQAGTTDIAVYRGTVSTGLGAPSFLDVRSAPASLRLSTVGRNGQQALIWSQSNGTTTSTWAAVAPTATGAFEVVDLGFQIRSNLHIHALNITDEGEVQYLEAGFFDRFRRIWRSSSGWLAREAIPSNEFGFGDAWAMNRRGDIVSIDFDGRWLSYDARGNRMVQSSRATPTPWVLGVDPTSSIPIGTVLLSQSGVGFASSINGRDVLPTPTSPAGDGRDVRNLWSWLFR